MLNEPEKDFTIDKVSWHTKVKGNPETPEQVKERFRIFVGFLKRNNLLVRTIDDLESIDDDFCLKRSDLSDTGLSVARAGYDKWLKQVVNKRKDTTNVTILEKALSEVLSEAS